MGCDLRVNALTLSGAGLVHERELVQLSVFMGEGPASAASARIQRPSRRRF